MQKELRPFTVRVVLDKPHEAERPSREEFAAVLSRIGFGAALAAVGRGFPKSEGLTDAEIGALLGKLFPASESAAAVNVNDEGDVTIRA